MLHSAAMLAGIVRFGKKRIGSCFTSGEPYVAGRRDVGTLLAFRCSSLL